MSMWTRPGGTIISQALAYRGVDPAQDPGSLLKPMGKVSAPPICHCLPPQKGRLGGMQPRMDLSTSEVRCATCMKVIGPSCRRREMVHLRGLLKLLETHPNMVDLDDARDAGFLLE